MTTPTPASTSGRGWITPVLITVGVIALIGAVASAAFGGIRMFTGGQNQNESLSVQGVTAIDVTSSSAEFIVNYADVDEALLDVSGVSGWTLEKRDSTLTVRPPRFWFGGWWVNSEQTVTLTLPRSLQEKEVDAAFELNSGALSATGVYDDLEIEVNAGRVDIEAQANDLDVTLNAGLVNVDVNGAREADYTVNAGRISASLADTPDSINIEVNAGSVDLVVPDDVYNVSSKVNAGSFTTNGLQTATASSHLIEVSLSAGNVTVRPNN